MVAAVILIQRFRPARLLPPRHEQLTFTGEAFFPSISPDGKFIAYASSGPSGDVAVFVQDLAGGQPLEVFHIPALWSMRWSPDGSELLISSAACVYFVPRLGGAAREFRRRYGTTWSPDGTTVAGLQVSVKRILFTNTVTGDTSSIALSGPFTWFSHVEWSPAGDMLACLEFDGQLARILTVKPDGRRQQTVLEDSVLISSPRWSSKGDAIYYLREHRQTADLMKIEIERRTGKAKGAATAVQTGLRAGSRFDLSKDNTKMLYTRVQEYSNLWVVKGGGQVEKKQLTKGTSMINDPTISPDGKTIAFNMGRHGSMDIFLMPIDGGPMKQLTFSKSGLGDVEWSPDGKQIAFVALDGGKARVWRTNSSGGTPRILASTEPSYTLAWAPGPHILYQQLGHRNFVVLDVGTEEERFLVPEDSPGWMFSPHYSPDGRMVAVYWNRRPDRGLWVISLEDSSQTFIAPDLSPIGWSSDGAWVHASKRSKVSEVVMVPASGGDPIPFMTLPLDDISAISMTPDGEYIVCNVYEYSSDIWLVENFDPEVD
jgi:Tol biopolymer transport system component